jgi:hypothetical protein
MRVNESEESGMFWVSQSEESDNTATVTEKWGQGLPGLGWLLNSNQQRGDGTSIEASVSIESEGSSTTSGENMSVSSGTSSEAEW